jgi:uncharacterized protein YlxW (UPF0749 family)
VPEREPESTDGREIGGNRWTQTRRPDLPTYVTLPLLRRVAEHSLTDDYVEAAGRRQAGSPPSASTSRTQGFLAVLAACGALVGIAGAQATRDSVIDQSSRAALVEQIDQRQRRLDAARAQLIDLQSDVAASQADLASLDSLNESTTNDLAQQEERAGFAAMRGPGIRVVLDDGDGADQAVRATDLAQVTDAVWGVGAEAIAVNGERLITVSAIRNVGVAVHVNGRPLSAPYAVEAIGDPRSLESDLVESARGNQVLARATSYGFDLRLSTENDLRLPAAPVVTLRAARLAIAEEKTDADNLEGTFP